MKKLLHKQNLDWKGTVHDLELYEADDISNLGFTNQAQAVPFVDDDHIVIFKHIDGYYSLPGGTIEEGEKFEETLRREVKEECACAVLDYGLIGYVKGTEVKSGKIKYQLRYWAKVKLLDEPINDPCGKAIAREVVPINEANKKLNWGERGQVLLDLAERKYKEHKPKVVTISIPEYTIETQPDYQAIGAKIDKAMANNFEGKFLVRELSMIDHPQYTLDEFADIILKTGTDKYDPNRKGVAHEEFEPYKPDLQAGEVMVQDGKIVGESFSEDIKRFYENVLLDRGYRLRIDLIVIYNPEHLVQAEKLDHTKPGTEPHLEQYLWRFKNQKNKPKAVVGIIKILR